MGSSSLMHLLAVTSLGASACVLTPPVEHRNLEPRPPLPPAQTGEYVITRAGEPVGRESFAITSTAGVWACEGRIELSWPVDQVQTYRLEIDRRTAEPKAFEISIELMGEVQRVVGTQSQGYVSGEVQLLTGPEAYEVAYAPGTLIDFGSPLFNAVGFALLGPSLKAEQPISVRTITVPVPFLKPAVVLQEYRFAGLDGDLRKVAVGPPRRKPTAFWVDDDGVPERLKTWSTERGPPFRYVRVRENETTR